MIKDVLFKIIATILQPSISDRLSGTTSRDNPVIVSESQVQLNVEGRLKKRAYEIKARAI